MSDNKVEERKVKDQISSSAIGISFNKLKRIYQRNKTTAITLVVLGFVIAFFLTGFMADLAAVKLHHESRYIELADIIGKGAAIFIPTGFIVGLVIDVLIFRFFKENYTELKTDEKNNTATVENQGSFGTAVKLEEKSEEFNEAFLMNEYCDTTELIIGRSLKYPRLTISPNFKEACANRNAIYFGAAGTGKSTCIISNYIFSKALLGESMIVTDTKGELFGLYKVFLENRGYVVKYLNFNPLMVHHSDQVNLFKPATVSDMACSQAADTIVQNLSHSKRKDDFWQGQQKNLLTCAMLYVKNDTQGEFPKKTLVAVQKFLQTDIDTIITKFQTVIAQDESTFFAATAKVWIDAADMVREQTLSGLRTDIAKIGIPVIQKILDEGDDDVDLTLPARRKCAYFVNLSGDKTDLQFISSLFFDTLFSELQSYADDKPNENGEGLWVDVRVTALLDEFTNIGVIPNWEKRISELRSRHIDIVMLCQGYEQVERAYPEKIAETILQNCHLVGFLGGKGISTLKVIQDMIGKGTVQVYKDDVPDPVTGKRPKITGREVYTLDELRRLGTGKMIFISARRNPLEVERLFFFNHPLYKELHPISAAKYRPRWVDKLDPREYGKYGIDISKYDEYKVVEEGTYEVCTEEDFAGFYHGKIGTLTENDDYSVMAYAKQRTEIREQIGDDATLEDIKEALRDNSLVYSEDAKKND